MTDAAVDQAEPELADFMPSGVTEIRDAKPVEDTRPDIVGMDRDDIKGLLANLGVAEKQLKMRANQIWQWVYFYGVTDFDAMTNMSKDLRAKLKEAARIGRPAINVEQKSTDGTIKWLLGMEDGREVEMVYIPESDRGTLCVSSQVGCTLSCSFCHTGTMKLVRNLGAAEIISQFMLARDRLNDWPVVGSRHKDGREDPEGRKLSNIVMMGMGEPLYNFDNVKKGLHILMDQEGINLSRRKITLSTSGVVPMMDRCGHEIGCQLAISLHAVHDPVRDELVPLNRKYDIEDLMDACRRYATLSNSRRITFEYVMLKDKNDSREDALELARLLKGIPAKINLIPFNKWPGSDYECSDHDVMEAFVDTLAKKGYTATVRRPRGRDILAACGQLKSASERKRGEKVDLKKTA